MNKSVISRSIKISFEICPFDSMALILVSFFLSALPAVVLYVYNSLIANIHVFYRSIFLIIGYCLLIFLQKSVYNFYNHYYLNYKTLLKFEKHMKLNFFKLCARLDLEDYFLPEIVNETRRAQNASINIFRVYQIVVEIIFAINGILLIGGIVFSIHPSLILFLLLAIISPCADNIYQIIQKRYLLYENTQKQKEGEAYVKLFTQAEHLKEIKVLGCFAFLFDKWEKCSQAVLHMEQRSQRKAFVVSIFFQLVRIAGTAGAYGCMTKRYMNQEISLAMFSMMIVTFSQVAQFFNQLFSLLGNLSEFAVMVKPYFAYLEKLSDRNYSKKTMEKVESDKSIVIKDCSYRYPAASSWALKSIGLTINQGDFISIVGENGSGKTTLSKIIIGLLAPAEGRVELQGLRDPEAFMDSISYVPQIFHCYCVSIKNNILFGKDMEGDLLDKAFDEVGLSGLKTQKEDLYGLEFGGLELSGGEKQRIAILRARFKKAAILLFDEPTSAIDPLQESLLYRSFLEASRGKTTIMISHRLALTKRSDLIIVLKNGMIAEQGSHAALIAKNGEYARMWRAQADLYVT